MQNKLNDKQKKVTQNIAWTILGDPSSVNILALQGPPGTGKSQVVVGLVRALIALKRNARILIVAPTNTAVDAVGRRIVKSVMEVDLIHRDEDDICDRLDSEDDDVSEVDESQFQYPVSAQCSEWDFPPLLRRRQARYFRFVLIQKNLWWFLSELEEYQFFVGIYCRS